MWCSENRRGFLAGLAALGLTAALAGCGFRPLYGDHSVGNTATDLSQVRVVPIADRTGQMLYNRLRDRLNPHGKPTEPLYTLEIKVVERSEDLLLEPNETASRTDLMLTANFKLRKIDGGATVLTGSSRSSISYDIQTSQYATIVSEQDVRQRATKQLSDDISTRLALYFTSGQTAEEPQPPQPETTAPPP
jgi:LPS-assembly lipoprotein